MDVNVLVTGINSRLAHGCPQIDLGCCHHSNGPRPIGSLFPDLAVS